MFSFFSPKKWILININKFLKYRIGFILIDQIQWRIYRGGHGPPVALAEEKIYGKIDHFLILWMNKL